jgi:N-acetylmuramoyl-L-alanine amidase
MKKSILFLLLLITSAVLVSFIDKKKITVDQKVSLRTIIIDPGHGGFDPGARGSFSTEADVSLAVSLKLGEAIQKEFPDIKIIYTRTTDIMPGGGSKDEGLRYRANLANTSGADLFIAVHCNSADPIRHRELTGYKTATVYVGKGKNRKKVTRSVPQYRYWYTPNPANGTETYIWAVSKHNDKVNSIQKNNDYYGEIDSTSTITLPDPDDPAEKARMLIYEQNYFRKSLLFADLIEKGFQAQGRTYRGGVKQRNDKGIWVLQATGMPSVLVEIGFISHLEEEKYLNSDKGQEEIVGNILQAVKTYKQRLESKSPEKAF